MKNRVAFLQELVESVDSQRPDYSKFTNLLIYLPAVSHRFTLLD